ncbi:DUF4873 domain-containing protein [Nocardioides sp. JQ2195]|uniref:DUF4873 domain-containing protein n=1 Tax=Nocardioides sp. JQ2195 TaxID=2592334 RepID=UPI00143E8FB3|nr:DUF4873 domain-containing protein [Nocardioides sp. JQ2195]QIX26000.1 DUF4873 domain-containing protein [Nocardioides sp. JQ2195]
MSNHLPEADEYAGPANLIAGETRLQVEVTLRSVFQPIDGHLHWYGRIARNPELEHGCTPGSTVSLTTPAGSAEGRINDVDPWGRFRIAGTGRPPF